MKKLALFIKLKFVSKIGPKNYYKLWLFLNFSDSILKVSGHNTNILVSVTARVYRKTVILLKLGLWLERTQNRYKIGSFPNLYPFSRKSRF